MAVSHQPRPRRRLEIPRVFRLLSALFLAPLLLVFAITAAAAAPKSVHVQAPAVTPDWKAIDTSGDDDEISPPLTLDQLTKAMVHATEGPRLYALSVSSGRRFAGDRPLLATVSPNGDGLRDQAVVHFKLERPATVTLRVLICRKHPTTVLTRKTAFGAGRHELVWVPDPDTRPQTYMLYLTVAEAGGVRHIYGSLDHRLAWLQPAPIVRVMGIDAGFTQRSYSPGDLARLRISTDIPSFTLQISQAGPETDTTLGDAMEGIPVNASRQVDWSAHRNAAAALNVQIGDWPNGVYFAELTVPDGPSYYAPFVVRPHPFGAHRVAVVLHTNTWHAYNHQDTNGDGWGDTWYAANDISTASLSTPYIRGGAPPKWRMYDLPFLHWLYRTDKQVDFISDDDLESFKTAKTLARLYDLIVFPGHEEYVTSHTYDLITGYRNRGGNLMFLATTNFLWKMVRHGNRITRVAMWRQLGRPESRIIGVQYRANDEGEHRGPYQLTPFGRRSWQFAGVDEHDLAKWRWLGIEYDMTTSVSPPGTHVLAQVNPHMPNPNVRGDMTYYTRGGAKVFASGTLNLCSGLVFVQFRTLFENLWQRLAAP
jgi:hypothetical protein